ncbi:hypothetical protein DNI29_11965 [Hymenobacter sediminis]|uniref:hypothetical protein n=1 Tax=Hymenobacter sediminis TaxID=2218621 RepID=UPI000DA646A7|nr:hypothetical protein [Hymenobacter sediminis]RPD46870.1 hypothetical protein DNI29_11965 [Hymenobacter sediminis]
MKEDQLSIYTEAYWSQLGLFELRVQTDNKLFRVEQDAATLQTVGHDIIIHRMYPPSKWLPDIYNVETAMAWAFYITKCNSSQEQLVCSIEAKSTTMQGTVETGQNLIAVGFEGEARQLHIGTEDEDAMASRANNNDWMPPRLRAFLSNYDLLITDVTPNGLITKIPLLKPGEQLYFHYIIAENPYRASSEYPQETDISTWIAVDQSKYQISNTWLEQAKKP